MYSCENQSQIYLWKEIPIILEQYQINPKWDLKIYLKRDSMIKLSEMKSINSMGSYIKVSLSRYLVHKILQKNNLGQNWDNVLILANVMKKNNWLKKILWAPKRIQVQVNSKINL
jgi:hypothetical protein